METFKTAYEVCWNCRGHGIVDGLWQPVTCDECHGNCMVRIRDDKGRFSTRELKET